MTADGDDHISPDKLNCLSKSSESQYNPSFLRSHVVLHPTLCLWTCYLWGGGCWRRQTPNLQGILTWLMSKKVSFCHGCFLFAKRSWCCLRAWNTFSPPQRSYTASSSCLCPLVFTMKAYLSKVRSPSSLLHTYPFVLATDFCLWLYNTTQWYRNGWYRKMCNSKNEKESKSMKIRCLNFCVC